jgi:sec-independent protein translocase protein TatB
MFGLSWGQITIIVLVGVFVLGPERIPTAVHWVTDGLRKLRTMAAGAQAQLNREIGPELDELRRQIADLQSLKELQELRELRELHPRRLIGNTILGEEFAGGGISGFLGLNGPALGGPTGTANGSPVSSPISSPISTVKPVTAVPPSAAATEVRPTGPEPDPPPAAAARPVPPPVAGGAPAGRLPAPKVVGAPRRVSAPAVRNLGPDSDPIAAPIQMQTAFDLDAT